MKKSPTHKTRTRFQLPGQLGEQLERLREEILLSERDWLKELALVAPVHRFGARNLVHYSALRSKDRTSLQQRLQSHGVDPLGRIEADVIGRISAIQSLDGRRSGAPHSSSSAGFVHAGKFPGMMVTLPAEAAGDAKLVADMVRAGAECFRINCARENQETWAEMIGQVRRVSTRLKARSSIFMDLGGSKLRVSHLMSGRKSLPLKPGDTLFMSRWPATEGFAAGDTDLPLMYVNEPEGLSGVKPGHAIWFDDGKIGGIVRQVNRDAVRLEITFAKGGKKRLRLERGVNLPDSPCAIPALTEKDRADIRFAARHAEFIALSFMRSAADVEMFRQALDPAPGRKPTIVLKIENRQAMAQLPALLLAGMRSPKVAVLLARGDLAVECGFENIAAIQETVLCLSRAAHLPLFWATDVLDKLSQTGMPSRAEMTDVALAARAQCVMLNKGPHVVDALAMIRSLRPATVREHQLYLTPLTSLDHHQTYKPTRKPG